MNTAYRYLCSEPGLYTVGFYDPAGVFVAESDHSTAKAAADRVHWLNGVGLPAALEMQRLEPEGPELSMSMFASKADYERARFEAWASPQGFRLHIRDMKGSDRFGQYVDDTTQAAWDAWRAARNG